MTLNQNEDLLKGHVSMSDYKEPKMNKSAHHIIEIAGSSRQQQNHLSKSFMGSDKITLPTQFEIQTIKQNTYLNVIINSENTKYLVKLIRAVIENMNKISMDR